MHNSNYYFSIFWLSTNKVHYSCEEKGYIMYLFFPRKSKHFATTRISSLAFSANVSAEGLKICFTSVAFFSYSKKKGDKSRKNIYFLFFFPFDFNFERERNASILHVVVTKRSAHWRSHRVNFLEQTVQKHSHTLMLVRLFRCDDLISRKIALFV